METKEIEFINRNKVNVEQLFEQNPNLILKLYKTIWSIILLALGYYDAM